MYDETVIQIKGETPTMGILSKIIAYFTDKPEAPVVTAPVHDISSPAVAVPVKVKTTKKAVKPAAKKATPAKKAVAKAAPKAAPVAKATKAPVAKKAVKTVKKAPAKKTA
jgi:hypothetical protein